MDMMIDFETWSLDTDNAALRSVGAVAFDPFAEPGKFAGHYYANIIDNDGTRSPSTEKWWNDQSREAQAVFSDPWPIPVVDALHGLIKFAKFHNITHVWSHGSVFDVTLCENKMKRLWLPIPWTYKGVQDTRTLYRFANVEPVQRPGYGIKHHAGHDAANQAHAVQYGVSLFLQHRGRK